MPVFGKILDILTVNGDFYLILDLYEVIHIIMHIK